METRTKWIIFMAIILAISLLWPLAYMMRGHRVNNQANQSNQSNSGPITITPLERYIANVNGTVTSVGSTIHAVAFGNAGSREEIESEIGNWTGVKSVNVTRVESNDPNYMYQFDIQINLTNWTNAERIGFWLSKKIDLTLKSALVDVNVSLPDNMTFQNMETKEIRVLPAPQNLKAFGYTYVKPGKNPVYVYLEMSGGQVRRALAIAGSQFYIPPMENVFESLSGNITKLDKSVVMASVGFGKTVNATELSKEWNASVQFFPDNEIVCENATIPSGINYTLVNGKQVIKFNNSSDPNSITSRIKGNCDIISGKLRVEAGPDKLDSIESNVSSIASVEDAYYLATVKIPDYIEINGEKQKSPTQFVDNVKTYKKSGSLNFTARITEAFGVVIGVSYGESF